MPMPMLACLLGLTAGLLAPRAVADDLVVPGQFPSIQAAVAAAQSGDRILVKPGTYFGPIHLDKKVLIQATEGPAHTILRGTGGTIVEAQNLIGAGAGLIGFTLTGGQGLAQPGGTTRGGAVHLVASNFVIERCVFTDNHVSGDGGAIFYDQQLLRALEISRTRFTHNSAGGRGGAVAVRGKSLPMNSRVERCDFRSNQAVGDGGAVWVSAIRAMELRRNQFHANTSEHSGGALALEVETQVLPSDCTFVGNSAALDGGALHVRMEPQGFGILPASLEFVDLRATDNTAGRHGGALHLEAILPSTSTLLAIPEGISLSGCLFVRNHAVSGGGALFKRLTASGELASEQDPRLLAQRCTFVENSADAGASAVHYESNVPDPQVARNLIVRGPESDHFGGLLPTLSFSNIEGGAPGDAIVDEDPVFFDPRNDVYALRSTSPARTQASDGGSIGYLVYFPTIDLGRSLPGEFGRAELSTTGIPLAGTSLSFALGSLPPGALAVLVLGFDAAWAPLKGGVLVPRPDVVSLPLPVGFQPSAGAGLLLGPAVTWPSGLADERSVYLQAWYADDTTPSGLAASNAVVVTQPTNP